MIMTRSRSGAISPSGPVSGRRMARHRPRSAVFGRPVALRSTALGSPPRSETILARLAGGDGLLQAAVGALLDGGAIALAPLDELQRLARERVAPGLRGAQGEHVVHRLLQHLARDGEALEDRLARVCVVFF